MRSALRRAGIGGGHWTAAALAGLVVLQALAVRLALERVTAAAAAALLAAGAALVLLAPAALRSLQDGLLALRGRLRWWHGLWLLLFLSDLVFRVRDAAAIQDAPVDFWAAYRMALIAGAGFVLLARVAFGHGEWMRPLRTGLIATLAVYCAICAASTLWSVYPSYTAYKSLEYFIDVCVVAAIVAHAGSARALQSLFDWTWLLMAALLGSVWLGAALWPDQAFSRDPGMVGTQLVGVMPQISGNGVGELSAVLAIVSLTRVLERARGRGLYLLAFAAAGATMLLAQTRSALMAFAFALAVLLFFSRRIGLSTLLAALLLLVVLQTSAAEVAWKYFLRGQDQQQFQTLSGRTGWWSAGWQRYLDRPWTGYGAYAGGRFVALADIENQGTTSSLHNTGFEILLGTGPWGLLPVLAALGGTWRVLLQALQTARERQLVLEALAVLALVTLRSVFTTHLIWHPSLSFLLVLAYAEYLRRHPARGQIEIRVRAGQPGESI